MKNLQHLLLTIFAILLLMPALSAQNQKGLLKGKVIDEGTEQALGYATISVYSVKDSSLVTGGITDDAGIFAIEVAPGNYYADITFLAFETKTIENITISPNKLTADLGVIGISSDATTLQEVEVRAEKSRMQMSLDKRVFNVGKDLANSGGNAAEVLDNVPSVAVDVEGNVSLRGSGNVRILVNGKPSGLIGISNTDGLRQLPADLIDRIEVVTNPSARYEAEGNAGVINIILKKDSESGLNGSFDLNAGQPDRYGAAVNLNYRKNDLNIFANYGANYRSSPGGGSTYQEFLSNNTLFISQQDRERTRGGFSNSIRAGLDYFFNENNILTSAFTYRMSNDANISEIEYRDYINSLDNLSGISIRRDEESELEPNLEYALTFRRNFDRHKDQELVIDFRYQDNTEVEESDIRERYFTPEFVESDAPNLFQHSYNEEIERQMIAQLDYIHPFGEEGKFEIGYRSSFRFINNDFFVEEFMMGDWTELPGVSNEFRYNEDVYAAYAIFGNKYGRFSFQLGARAELSNIRTELFETNEVNDRNYLNFFPSTHISYELPSQNAVQLSYSRRISRPRFWDLNPFFSFSDARNFRSGNPNLDPEFTHSIEFGHLKYWDNASLSSSVYYRHTDGVIDRIQTIDNQGNTISQPQNLAEEDAFGAEMTFSVSPYKWWDVDGSVNFYRSIVNGGNLAPNLQADFYSWFTRINSKMEVFKFMDAQLRLNYRAPRNTTQGRDKAEYYMDLAFSKDILKNKGTITLSARDVFNTRKRRFITQGANFYREGDFQWRARQVILTFNYRLNQKKRDRGRDRGDDYDGGGDEFN